VRRANSGLFAIAIGLAIASLSVTLPYFSNRFVEDIDRILLAPGLFFSMFVVSLHATDPNMLAAFIANWIFYGAVAFALLQLKVR
jgi:hypothetical protein